MKKNKLLTTLVFLLWMTTAFSQNLENGLIAKFLFSGNIKDSSIYNHNTYDINSNTSFKEDRFGETGKALNTISNLSPIAVQVKDNPVFNLSSSSLEYSISCWIYSESGQNFDAYDYILCQKLLPTEWLYYTPNYELNFGCTTDYWSKIDPNYGWIIHGDYLQDEGFPSNGLRLKTNSVWNHYVLTRKNNITKYYLNGDSVLQFQDSGHYTDTQCAGAHLWFYFGPTNANDTRIDDVLLYNRKLTDEEIKLLYGDYHNIHTGILQAEVENVTYKLVNNELIFDQTYKKLELMDISGRKLLSIKNVNTLNLDNIKFNVLLVSLYEDNKPKRVIKIVKP